MESENIPINIVFDGPPSHESGRFVECETDDGKGISVGEWVERPDGLWALRITSLPTCESSGAFKCNITLKELIRVMVFAHEKMESLIINLILPAAPLSGPNSIATVFQCKILNDK